MDVGLSFEAEVPIPDGNLTLYRRIYVLEQWLRRVAMASLMSRYATQWRSAIPTEISKDLKGRRQQLSTRTYLDVESSDNVVWLLALEELRRILASDFLWPSVKDLTGFQRADLNARINELREIRNVVGHNRATTPQTMRIFAGIEEYLGRGVARFKRATLYTRPDVMYTSVDPSNPVSIAVDALCDGKLRQVFLEETPKFNSIVSLPVEPFTFVSIPDLVEAFHDARHIILAMYVNSTANEFSVVWPRAALAHEHGAVVEGLASFLHYTEAPYADQDPKYVCDPRVWFYLDSEMPKTG